MHNTYMNTYVHTHIHTHTSYIHTHTYLPTYIHTSVSDIGNIFLYFLQRPARLWEGPNLISVVYWNTFLMVNLAGVCVDHSHPSSAAVKN